MTHDILDHLNIGLVFTKSAAKSVPGDMTAEPRNNERFSTFPFCKNLFLGIIIINNSFDLSIDAIGIMQVPQPCSDIHTSSDSLFPGQAPLLPYRASEHSLFLMLFWEEIP